MISKFRGISVKVNWALRSDWVVLLSHLGPNYIGNSGTTSVEQVKFRPVRVDQQNLGMLRIPGIDGRKKICWGLIYAAFYGRQITSWHMLAEAVPHTSADMELKPLSPRLLRATICRIFWKIRAQHRPQQGAPFLGAVPPWWTSDQDSSPGTFQVGPNKSE